MSGVAAIRQVLAASIPLTAIVPATRIMAGMLPIKTTLPAIGIATISAVDRNIPAPGGKRHVDERVQVTIMGKDYPQAKAILRLVKLAAADMMPIVAGISEVTVRTDGAGPDFTEDEVSIPMQMQDFMVGYNEPTF